MTNNPPNTVQATAMPPQIIQPLAPGATSPMQSAQIQQQQQTDKQMALIGKSGGGKRRSCKRRSCKRRQYRGGANGVANNTQIIVPSVQPGAVNASQTESQYTQLAALSSKQASESVYDKGNTAAVAANQQGGKRMRYRKTMKCRKGMRGGMWPVWGCLSGGRRRTRRTKKGRNKRHRR